KAFSFSLWRSDRHVLMPSENTVILFEQYGEGVWSMHVATVRHNRKILDDGREAVRWMFENVEDCSEIVGIPPEGKREVSLYARRLCRSVGGEWNNNTYRVRRAQCHLL
ncbi:MAG: hypothetical protein PHW59_12915, partial [Desulfobacterales bacterium]|nr:hypothetical protein [Desulfobacterales bacterium]